MNEQLTTTEANYNAQLERQNRFIELVNMGAVVDDWQNGAGNKPASEFTGNRGLRLSDDTEPLTDVDLDIPEAEYMMREFCGTNTLAIGRGGKITHYIYSGALDLKPFSNLKNDDDDKAHILHVRHKDKQTMWVDSLHKSGQTIELMQDLEPLPVPPIDAIRKAATAALVAHKLPKTGRHDVSLALAGFLKNRGVAQDDCKDILEAAWEYHDGDVKAVRDNIEDSYENEIVTGGPTLNEEIEGLPDAIAKIWGWGRKQARSFGEPTDIGKAIREGIEPPEELVSDEILKGAVTGIFAGSGDGKTMYALHVAAEVMKQGLPVIYLDGENGARIIADRMSGFVGAGLTEDRISKLFKYYAFPGLTTDDEMMEQFKRILDDTSPALVIFDSWINWLARDGKDENSNTDVEIWSSTVLGAVRARGMSVVVLDHEPKNGTGSRGAGRKKDFVDVQWHLDKKEHFDRDTVGRLVLKQHKERQGFLPDEVTFKVGGDFTFERVVSDTHQDQLDEREDKLLDVLRHGLGGRARAGEWQELAKGLHSISRADFFRIKGRLVKRRAVGVDGKYFVLNELFGLREVSEVSEKSQAEKSQDLGEVSEVSEKSQGESTIPKPKSQRSQEGLRTKSSCPDEKSQESHTLVNQCETQDSQGEPHEEVI